VVQVSNCSQLFSSCCAAGKRGGYHACAASIQPFAARQSPKAVIADDDSDVEGTVSIIQRVSGQVINVSGEIEVRAGLRAKLGDNGVITACVGSWTPALVNLGS
jgi:hypothetical protein